MASKINNTFFTFISNKTQRGTNKIQSRFRFIVFILLYQRFRTLYPQQMRSKEGKIIGSIQVCLCKKRGLHVLGLVLQYQTLIKHKARSTFVQFVLAAKRERRGRVNGKRLYLVGNIKVSKWARIKDGPIPNGLC